MPDVHPRLRKRLARCTLDCGFKTSESPALRGFVAERGPITGTSLYLVLLSNGLLRPKNLPVKFGFSPKPIPANIVKKLPLQRCSKPFFIAFSTSRTNGLRSLSQAKAGTHSALLKGSHTRAHTAKQVVFWVEGGITTLGAFRTFTNIPGPGIRTANFAAFGSWLGVLQKDAESLGTAMRSCASLFRGVAAPLGCVIQRAHY